MEKYINLVEAILSRRVKTASTEHLKNELLRYASSLWLKEAFFKDLSKGLNEKSSLPYYYYTAWACMYAKGLTKAEPSDNTLPSKFRDLKSQLRSQDKKAHSMIMLEWDNKGKSEWNSLLQKMGSTFKDSYEDLGTDLFARYFLTSHSQNKSAPDASRSSAGKMQSELKGGVWYRLNKDPSKYGDIASSIKYVGNYIRRIYDPKSTHFTKREVIPGELKDRRYLTDLDTEDNMYGNPLENIEDKSDYSPSLLDVLEGDHGVDPIKAERQINDLIQRALSGNPLKENATYRISKKEIQEKKDLLALSAWVLKMLDEDWSMVVAKRWDPRIAQDIVETCSEVSTQKLAPMVIKNYKFMNIDQLKSFASFVDNCMDSDSKIYNPKIKSSVKRGKSEYAKKMRRRTKSIPQWVNLFLAVNRGFVYETIQIQGKLHGSAKMWGTSMARIAENSTDPKAYVLKLWEACKECMPVKTMSLNKKEFLSTMMRYIDLYNEIREKEMGQGNDNLNKILNIYKERLKTYFKDSSEKYPSAIIAIPMAEGVRMSLILSVLPDQFEKELTTNNIVTCSDILKDLFRIPQSVIKSVQDLTSDLIVDDIIDIVEEEVEKGPAIEVSK